MLHGDDAERAYLLTRQYRDGANLSARVALHARFSTNPHGWHRWLFEQLAVVPGARLLELGCGTGELWRANAERVPADWRIALSDFSPGMLAAARERLGSPARGWAWQVIDAQALPYRDASLDVVIANHMLYHVPDRRRALAEIRRVLRPGGHLYAATNGQAHLRELDDGLESVVPGLGRDTAAERFGLENGAAQLAPLFAAVALRRYSDGLAVTEVGPVLAYARSTAAADRLDEAGLARLGAIVAGEIARSGAWRVTKAAGLFCCRA